MDFRIVEMTAANQGDGSHMLVHHGCAVGRVSYGLFHRLRHVPKPGCAASTQRSVDNAKDWAGVMTGILYRVAIGLLHGAFISEHLPT